MDDDRSLKAVFDGLAGRSDVAPHELLESLGAHADLPGELLTAALGSYAETAPAEVAEHLAPFLTGGGAPAEGLELLAGAPVADDTAEVLLGDDVVDLGGLDAADQLDDADLQPDETGPGDAAEPDMADVVDVVDVADVAESQFGFGDAAPGAGHDDATTIPDLDPTAGTGAPGSGVPGYDETPTGLDDTHDTHDPFLQPEDDLDNLFDPDDDDPDD